MFLSACIAVSGPEAVDVVAAAPLAALGIGAIVYHLCIACSGPVAIWV